MGIRSLSSASIATGTKRSKFWDQSTEILTTGFYSIATGIVDSSGASSITFSSIPQTFSHLQLRCYVKGTGALSISFNGSTSGYVSTFTEGDGGGGAVGSGRESANTSILLYGANAATTPSNYFGHSVIDIPNYANTNVTKTLRALNGWDYNSSNPKGYIDFDGGFWNNTNAVTSITVGATSFVQNAQVSLYGIR